MISPGAEHFSYMCSEYLCRKQRGSAYMLYNKLWHVYVYWILLYNKSRPLYVQFVPSVQWNITHPLAVPTFCSWTRNSTFNRSQVENGSHELGSHWIAVSQNLSYLTSDCDCTTACYVHPELRSSIVWIIRLVALDRSVCMVMLTGNTEQECLLSIRRMWLFISIKHVNDLMFFWPCVRKTSNYD
jgi:hypothetical protein